MPDHTPDAPSSSGREPPPLPGVVAFVGMGLSIAATVGAGVLLGLLVDRWLHTAPAFLIVGLVLGVAASVAAVRAQIKAYL